MLPVIAMRWFPNHKGLVTGICFAYFGGGTFIFDVVETAVVNPKNVPFDASFGYIHHPQLLARLPRMFLYLAVPIVAAQLLAVYFIRDPPTSVNNQNQNQNQNQNHNINNENNSEYEMLRDKTHESNRDSENAAIQPPLTMSEAVQTAIFWQLFAFLMVYTLICITYIAEWKESALTYLLLTNDEYLSVVGGVSTIVAACGRLFWGAFFDWNNKHNERTSAKLTFACQSGAMAVLFISYPLCRYAPQYLFPIWNCMIWFNINSQYTILPSMITRVFGARHLTSILSLFFIPDIFACVLVATVFSSGVKSYFGGWQNCFFVFGGGLFAITLLACTFTTEKVRAHSKTSDRFRSASTSKSSIVLAVGSHRGYGST
jgi:hypothetical protein